MEWLFGLEPWLAHLIIGLKIVALMGFGAVILVKARLSPLWVLLLLVPYAGVVALWAFAYARWPRFEGRPRRRLAAGRR